MGIQKTLKSMHEIAKNPELFAKFFFSDVCSLLNTKNKNESGKKRF